MRYWLTGARLGFIAWIILMFILVFIDIFIFGLVLITGWLLPLVGYVID